MKNEINAVLENMTTTIPEPEDYTGEDGLLYCGKCRKPKEAYFAPDKAAIFGRDRHPAECDCQRTAREEREAAEKRRRHLDTVLSMCVPVRFTGDNFRQETAKRKMESMKKLITD